MEAEDLDLFRRSLAQATERSTGAMLDAALVDLGWLDALAADPATAIAALFPLLGATNATSAALDRVLAHGIGTDPGGAVILPGIGRSDPPGTLADGALAVAGLATGPLDDSAPALVVAATSGGPVACTVPVGSLQVRAVEGIDPGFGLREVTATSVGVTSEPIPLGAGWDRAVDLGRLAVAHQLVGAARTMLELARQHARERIQFGVPISSFQAVRHRLAETLVAIEMAEAVIDGAWLAGTADAAAMAKAVAGRQARTAMRHCQQVLAGIGFTTEHPLHRSIRRVLVLDGLLGTAATLTRDLGTEVLRSGHLPPLLPL